MPSAAPTILHVVGARPNFMKMAPVHRALAANGAVRSRILHTGQHYDRLMSDVFFDDLQLPVPDISLGVGSGSHAEQTAGIMVAFETHVRAERPDLVVVYGDVNSTLAAALVCAKERVPLAHVEAGLRSGDRTMPEEINRIVTDRVADLLLVTEPSGRENLRREGIAADRIRETGNCMIDSLAALLAREGITRRQPSAGKPRVLVTLHRPSNVDDQGRFGVLAAFLLELAETCELLFPVHPRTRVQLQAGPLGAALAKRVTLVEPLRYQEFVRQLAGSSLVVTDSGGIQEEAAWVGVPTLTLRSTTERPITVAAGTNLLEAAANGDLAAAARRLMTQRYPDIGQNPVLLEARWDGRSGERCAREITSLLGC